MPSSARGSIQPLAFPFTVSPSGGGLEVYVEEERYNAYATLWGYSPGLYAPDRVERAALITVRGVVQVIYGYPNEEAYWKDQRGHLGHGVSEIVGSSWTEEVDQYNRASFGTEYLWGTARRRHFFVGSKDASAQLLAREIDLEVFDTYDNARTEARRRLEQSAP